METDAHTFRSLTSIGPWETARIPGSPNAPVFQHSVCNTENSHNPEVPALTESANGYEYPLKCNKCLIAINNKTPSFREGVSSHQTPNAICIHYFCQ